MVNNNKTSSFGCYWHNDFWIYPAFVFKSIFGATLIWLYYVVPNISGLFKQMQVDLSIITKVKVVFSNHVHDYFFIYLLFFILLVIVLTALYKYNQRFRYRVHQFLFKLPISITSEINKGKIAEVRKSVKRGNTLTDELRLAKVFPSFVLRLTSIGEQTGTLDTQLKYLAVEYRKRFEHTVASISEMIQPLVIIFTGLLFILMIIALFLPVYKLIGEVGILRGGQCI